MRYVLDGVYEFGYALYTSQVFHNEAKIIPKVQYFIVQGYDMLYVTPCKITACKEFFFIYINIA